MIHVETPRLRLRDWREEDVAPFCRMNADKQVMTYFPKTLSDEETRALYQVIIAEIRQSGFGLYAAELKQTSEFIGFIGFHKATFEADFTPCVEIGWRLKADAWGNGYATEGAEACLRHGFGALGLEDVFSFTAEINKPSIRVMEKAGMRFSGTFEHPKVEQGSPLLKHVLYKKSK